MTDTLLIGIITNAMMVALKLAGPFLLVSIVLGLLISIFQATTQIQEQTLTFVPKLFGIAAVGLFLGTWMLHTLINFTQEIFTMIATLSS
ncbi:flagellar biosynthetic protein FliQ [uncultured Clostridium sp.]|uniref:flagellar biosynthetic protein FliQ n=1 Tax=uncultured Clostridium sp. TaxID=59620 RepID=UPI00263649F3|nr:flagellar biosynthetic protein FliQ [uncultured Clostridium sp.]